MSVEIVTSTAPPRPRRRAPRALAGAGLLLVLAGLWVRGVPSFVAWEVARDHQRCSGRRHLPARVWSADPAEVHEWLEARGTPTPPLPAYAHASELVGARYCPLLDRVAAHVYYGGEGAGIVSVFVLSGPARIGDGWAGTVRGLHVRLLRAAARTLAVVGESEGDVVATARAFLVTVAAADRPTPAARPARSGIPAFTFVTACTHAASSLRRATWSERLRTSRLPMAFGFQSKRSSDTTSFGRVAHSPVVRSLPIIRR